MVLGGLLNRRGRFGVCRLPSPRLASARNERAGEASFHIPMQPRLRFFVSPGMSVCLMEPPHDAA